MLSPDSHEESSHSARLSRRMLFFGLYMVLVIVTSIFLNLYLKRNGHHQITIYVPIGLIAVFISFYIFGEYNRIRQAKTEERREMLQERRQELLNKVTKKKAPGKDPERNN